MFVDKTQSSYRIAYLVNELGQGTVARDLANSINEHTNMKAEIISLRKPSENIDRSSVIYPAIKKSSSRSSLSTLRWLSNIINNFDIIIAIHTYAGLLGAALARVKGKPVVAREGNNHQEFSLQVRSARTITGLLADKIVCVSQSVADSYCGFERVIPNSKLEVITNGVDVDKVQSAKSLDWSIYKQKQIDPDASVIGTVGMLTEQKNHETLIKSIDRLLRNRSIAAELVIAGSGPRRDYLENLAFDLGVKGEVHFLGYVERDQVYKMLHEIDCYAMPSRWEGFSAAVLQAMAAGVPCVLSRIPSFESQYSESVARFHQVESVVELENTLFNLLQNDTAIGERGRKFVFENHSIEQMANEYATLYHTLRKIDNK